MTTRCHSLWIWPKAIFLIYWLTRFSKCNLDLWFIKAISVSSSVVWLTAFRFKWGLRVLIGSIRRSMSGGGPTLCNLSSFARIIFCVERQWLQLYNATAMREIYHMNPQSPLLLLEHGCMGTCNKTVLINIQVTNFVFNTFMKCKRAFRTQKTYKNYFDISKM